MYLLEVSFHATISRFKFEDADKAASAYKKVSEALATYREYRNDRKTTVEIDGEDGPATLSLERIDAILLSECHDEKNMRQALQREALARRLRDEFGLPDLTPSVRSPQVNATENDNG